MFEQVLQEIRNFDRIIIHRHSRPDGDALGSQIGLKHIIKDTFPQKTVYVVGDASRRYGFMEDSVMDEIGDEVYQGALAIILDTSAKALICDDRYTLAAATARIDHHLFCEEIAEVEVTDSSYESCEFNQIVVDYIASMTDDYFIDLHRYLYPYSKLRVDYTGYFDTIMR